MAAATRHHEKIVRERASLEPIFLTSAGPSIRNGTQQATSKMAAIRSTGTSRRLTH
jgi:hypothetical protein